MGESAQLKNLWVLMITAFVSELGSYLVIALLPFYAVRFDATPFVVGALISVFALAQMLTAPLWGRISDRWGRRPIILIGLSVSAAAYVLFALADSIWVLLLSRLAQGAGAGTISAILAYVGDAVVPEERAQALGWLTAATSAAAMLGPALGSLTALLSPNAPGLVTAGLCIVNVFIAWLWLPDPAKVGASEGGRNPLPVGSLRRSFADVLRHPTSPVSSVIWVYYFAMMAFAAVIGIVPLYLERSFGVTEENIWIFFFYIGAINVLMRALVVGPAVRRLGEVKVLRLGALSFGFGLAMTPFAAHEAVLALAVLFVPMGTSLLFPCNTSLVSRCAPKTQMGQILGVQQSFGAISRILGPFWAGAAFQFVRIESPFWIGSAMVLLVALLTARLPQPPHEVPAMEPTAPESL